MIESEVKSRFGEALGLHRLKLSLYGRGNIKNEIAKFSQFCVLDMRQSIGMQENSYRFNELGNA